MRRRTSAALRIVATARVRLALATLLSLAVILSSAQLGHSGVVDTIAPEDIGSHIAAIEGPRHGLGSEAEKTKLGEVATYIHDQFAGFGLTVQEQPVTYGGETFPNVSGVLPGTLCPDTSIIVGAHYDSVSFSPGADDNASGVAGVLEAARVLSSQSFPASIEFVTFSFEEDGLIGSQQMAAKASGAGRDIVGVLALDMIGYYTDEPGSQTYPEGFPPGYSDTGDFIAVIGNEASHSLVKTFMSASASAVPGLATESLGDSVPGGGLSDDLWSDHVSFWNVGYQGLLITDTAWFRNPNAHLPSDTSSTLDLDFAADVANAVVAAVVESVKDPATACPGIPTPTPTPKDPDGDTDGDTIPNGVDPDDDNDSCTDLQELGPDPGLGGQRDPHDFWDYADMPDANATPQRDMMVRIGDVVRVLSRYGTDDEGGTAPISRWTDPLSTPPKTGYHPAYDRGQWMGPRPWDVEPPNGTIRVADIVYVINQYGHDCA